MAGVSICKEHGRCRNLLVSGSLYEIVRSKDYYSKYCLIKIDLEITKMEFYADIPFAKNIDWKESIGNRILKVNEKTFFEYNEIFPICEKCLMGFV